MDKLVISLNRRLLALLACIFLLLAGRIAPAGATTATGYTDIASASTSLCLGPAGDSTAGGAAIQQLVCNGSNLRQWTLRLSQDGYQIIGRQTGLCLTVSGASTADGAPLVQQACATGTNQVWDVQANGDGWVLRARHSGKCVEVPGNTWTVGTNLHQWNCFGATHQRWQFAGPAFAASKPAAVVARSNGLCLGVRGASQALAADLVQGDCGGGTQQRWTLRPWGDYFLLAAGNSGQCADVADWSTADGGRIIQYTCNGNWNQQWALRLNGDQWQLVSRYSNKCLSATGSGQDTTIVQRSCNSGADQAWSLATPQLAARWTAPITTPIIPIAVANLPDGRILGWSAFDRYTFGNDAGQTWTMLFNPANNTSSEALVTYTGHDMFCPGIVNLPDGRIHVAGGSDAYPTSIYDPWMGGWVTAQRMNVPRGYQGNALLPDGSVLTLGGSWSGGFGDKYGEVWTQAGGWRALPAMSAVPATGPDPRGSYRGDNHMWIFSLSGGRILHAGPHSQMHWLATGGSGGMWSAGTRGSDDYAMDGNAVLYDIDRILKVGGAPAYEQLPATGETYVLDARGSGVSSRRTAPMAYTRGFHNSVVLPDGQVVVVGGQRLPLAFSDDDSRLVPEVWNPRTEVFSKLPAMVTPRNYHSVALLMQDGRIFVGGGGQCGFGCATNHFNAEILTPPALLNADGTAATRPSVTWAPDSVGRGQQIAAYSSPPVKNFVLMRLSSVTHSTNNEQRRIPLTMTASQAGAYTLTIPGEWGVVLPGYYWLVGMDARGVPSVGRTIRVW